MKTAALKNLRSKLTADLPVYGLWVTLESPSITEMAVALGVDWVVIDAEHGHLDWKEIIEHVRAAVRSNTVVLVRVAEHSIGLIKRALDIGADGVMVPWVESADQLRQAVSFAQFPPEGVRGIGAERATCWGQCFVEHTQEANEHVLVVPIIESVKGGQNIQAMLQVDGVDIFFVGPADYSSSAGYRGQWEGPGVADELLAIQGTVRAAGKHCGIIATNNENLQERVRQGFRMLGLGTDAGLLLRSLHGALATVGRDRTIVPTFSPESDVPSGSVIDRPPEIYGRESLEAEVTGVQSMNGSARKQFVVALTADFFGPDGSPKYRDLGLSVFEGQSQIVRHTLAEHRPQIGCDQLGDAQGVIVLTPSVTAETVSQSENLLAVGRFGVGYDAVDVAACTAADVVVFITAGAVDRSVAEATVGWMIAITHHMRIKDQLVRTGRWDERSRYMGSELRDRVVGVIGLGGIARATLELLRGFGMRQPLACDPLIPAAEAARLGVRLVTLEQLLREADFVTIHCPLSEQTRGMIGARELSLMKPGAYLINTARGQIVDEDALYQALQRRQIAGAAIDCFAQEPVTTPLRFGELDNVLLAPHSIAWTNELFRDIGRAVCQGMIDLSLGRRPKGVVNPAVLERPGFRAKWQRLCGDISQ